MAYGKAGEKRSVGIRTFLDPGVKPFKKYGHKDTDTLRHSFEMWFKLSGLLLQFLSQFSALLYHFRQFDVFHFMQIEKHLPLVLRLLLCTTITQIE